VISSDIDIHGPLYNLHSENLLVQEKAYLSPTDLYSPIKENYECTEVLGTKYSHVVKGKDRSWSLAQNGKQMSRVYRKKICLNT
jgi:hypothetical protein